MEKYFVIDVESIGLHGDPFAVGWVVVDQTGAELECGVFAISPQQAIGEDRNREWVTKNVPFITPTHPHLYAMLADFWKYWTTLKESGPVLMFAECAWPVEARFLSMCVNEGMPKTEWQGPYPLHDIASVMFAKGMDPMATYARSEEENPAHHPTSDARQSARLLIEALKI